eukprot:TRINITY_DN57026_c0_g1_i1.p1 TRINITY_DN57026_c0_g1~~TRINITY_DN57026_c0_g1_i1.p1  ORF type:complete len:590 (-),score=168.09 TRINITY_DN57026_c0_g1_i1:127-1896(-)
MEGKANGGVGGGRWTSLEAALEEAEGKQSRDYLRVTRDGSFTQTLEVADEEVLWADNVEEVNRKAKAHKRALVLTTLAIYTFPAGNYKAPTRRIPIKNIASLTFSDSTDDLVIRSQNEAEFDHWLRTKRRNELAKAISALYLRLNEQELPAEIAHAVKLPSIVFTKDASEVNLRLSKTGDVDKLSPSAKVNFTNKVRSWVSKKKVRYREDGFDLDLTYITDRLIAMGFPSEGSEGLFRNPLPEVYRLLESKHKDHYKVYNLCSERSYNTTVFHKRVGLFPFDDHNCPEFKMILDFCLDVHDWMTQDSLNVAAIHCKAGKGRTGLMISCYFLFSNQFKTSKEALEYFGKQRTRNGKGVTIPSQKRYTEYFAKFLSEYRENPSGFFFQGNPYVLTNVRITTVPRFAKDKGCDPYFLIRDFKSKKIYDSRKFAKTKHYKDEAHIDIPCSAFVRGDIKFIFYNEEEYSNDSPMCHFWIHTNFVDDNYVKLTKGQIDKAVKDVEHKKFNEKFAIELYFRPDDIVTAEEMKQKNSMTKEQVLEEAFNKIKEAEQELKELVAQREQLEEDIEIAIEEIKAIKIENETLKRSFEGLQ